LRPDGWKKKNLQIKYTAEYQLDLHIPAVIRSNFSNLGVDLFGERSLARCVGLDLVAFNQPP